MTHNLIARAIINNNFALLCKESFRSACLLNSESNAKEISAVVKYAQLLVSLSGCVGLVRNSSSGFAYATVTIIFS